MEANSVIEIKPMHLRNQKMSEDGELRLEFFDSYFKYIGNFYADEPTDREDHSLGWDMVYNYFEVVADKKCVSGFEKSWSHLNEHWSVYIFINGMNDDIKLFFKTQKEADAVMEKLINYLYGN